ncbi:MAG TPA: SLATT domain-containing protein, partial [Actinomycetes bacterium]|nr:SLATT domain-containing protein [Actinomycetes bacterium]
MASRPPTVSIDESDFPALYHAAERNSFDGQRRFLTAAQLRLVMLVVAAVFGLITWRRGRADLAAVVAGAAFSAALLAELYLLRRRPDRLW